MLFEGNQQVLAKLFEKKRLLEAGDPAHEKIRPVLLAASGIMRGVYGGGQAVALSEHGLRDVFDVTIGISTGAPIVAYYLSDQASTGISIYHTECTNSEFVSSWRAFRGRHIIDVDYLTNVFRGESRPEVMLDCDAVRASRPEFYVGATCGETGTGEFIDAKTVEPDMFEAIRASIAIPGFSHGKVQIADRVFLDGGGALPFPIRHIINTFNPTDLIVLPNHPYEENELQKRPRSLDLMLSLLMRSSFPQAVKDAFRSRHERHVAELKHLRKQTDCRFAIFWADEDVGPLESNAEKLEAAAERALAHTSTLLTQARDHNYVPA